MAKKEQESAAGTAADATAAPFGQAAGDRSEHGKLVVVHEDVERSGKLYKAGNADLPVSEADALIEDGRAYEPEGKGKGRDEAELTQEKVENG